MPPFAGSFVTVALTLSPWRRNIVALGGLREIEMGGGPVIVTVADAVF
jgi:hypothetical protein